LSRPFILITNDDGYSAPGIQALATAFEQVADVAVVAPAGEQSGVGRHITLTRPLRASVMGQMRWTVDGTPTDCVYLALQALLDRRPDLVVSGINRGPNLGEDVLYSGTVAGAMEGASSGVPSMALSLAYGDEMNYEPAAAFAVDLAQYLLTSDWPSSTVLNVNVPDTGERLITGYRWTRGGLRDYRRQVTVKQDPRGNAYYWIGGQGLGHVSLPGSDCDAIDQGHATLTPLCLEMTDFSCLEANTTTMVPGYTLV